MDATATMWVCVASGTPGTWVQVGSGGGGGTTILTGYDETPAGAVNGVNVTFTLSATPSPGALNLFMNGVHLTDGVDFTRAGAVITMLVAPLTGFALRASYWVSGTGTTALGGDLGGTIADGFVQTVRGVTTALTYDGLGRLDTLTTALGTKTFTYNGDGTLAAITGTGQYHSKTFAYVGGVLTGVTVL